MILVLLAGCISGGDLAAIIPTVKFNSLELKGLTWEDIDVDFKFDVDNPNPIDIPLQRFNYGLDLSDIEIISGDSPDGLNLEAEGQSVVTLPLNLSFGGIYDLVEAARGVDTLPFRLRGGFGWDTDIGPVDIDFDEDGEFPALRMPDMELGDLGVTSIDGDSANFNLGLDVDNDHGSTLDFDNVDFAVKFGGVSVASGKEDTIGSVEGASSRTLDIPFGVDYVDAASAILTGSTDVEFGADMDVDTPFGIVPLTLDENGDLKVRDETD